MRNTDACGALATKDFFLFLLKLRKWEVKGVGALHGRASQEYGKPYGTLNLTKARRKRRT